MAAHKARAVSVVQRCAMNDWLLRRLLADALRLEATGQGRRYALVQMDWAFWQSQAFSFRDTRGGFVGRFAALRPDGHDSPE